jgi:hypothetical protein
MPVNTQHPDYSTMVGRWKRCRDAADGEDAVHNAAETYLPKLKDQTPTDYQAYVMRAPSTTRRGARSPAWSACSSASHRSSKCRAR